MWNNDEWMAKLVFFFFSEQFQHGAPCSVRQFRHFQFCFYVSRWLIILTDYRNLCRSPKSAQTRVSLTSYCHNINWAIFATAQHRYLTPISINRYSIQRKNHCMRHGSFDLQPNENHFRFFPTKNAASISHNNLCADLRHLIFVIVGYFSLH